MKDEWCSLSGWAGSTLVWRGDRIGLGSRVLCGRVGSGRAGEGKVRVRFRLEVVRFGGGGGRTWTMASAAQRSCRCRRRRRRRLGIGDSSSSVTRPWKGYARSQGRVGLWPRRRGRGGDR
jgi:hypothetical protein